MNDLLIPASFVLVILFLVVTALWLRQCRETERIRGQLDALIARKREAVRAAERESLFIGWRRGWSECYTIAFRAHRDGISILEALRRAAPVAEEETPAELEIPV